MPPSRAMEIPFKKEETGSFCNVYMVLKNVDWPSKKVSPVLRSSANFSKPMLQF